MSTHWFALMPIFSMPTVIGGVTVMVRVAEAVWPVESLIVYGTTIVPYQPLSGV